MKIRIVTLAMMTLIVSAGPLMAMDSEYQEKRRQALYQESASSAIQAERSIDQHRDPDANKREGQQHRLVDDEGEVTREALRYWWN